MNRKSLKLLKFTQRPKIVIDTVIGDRDSAAPRKEQTVRSRTRI